MRICSFLPSATEMLYALGLGDSVSGVTFECDFPPQARQKRVIVNTRIHQTVGAAEIDRQVNDFVMRGESLYEVDAEALEAIAPDLIITQDLCHVCAATPGDLGSALAAMRRPPQVLSLSPMTLGDVWNDIEKVGEATGRPTEAAALVREIEERITAVGRAVAGEAKRPRAVCLEWLDPPFIAGHWVPEMVDRAGGIDALGEAGKPGFRTTWESIFNAGPEVITVMPCGYHLKETTEEFRNLPRPQGWESLPAVANSRVFAVDGSSYFSRPGPRLADGVEILAQAFHPGLVATAPEGSIEGL